MKRKFCSPITFSIERWPGDGFDLIIRFQKPWFYLVEPGVTFIEVDVTERILPSKTSIGAIPKEHTSEMEGPI